MIVFFHEDFYEEYTSDPAAESGRMEAIVETISPVVDMVKCEPAAEEDLLAAHSKTHLNWVYSQGLFEIAALAAGGAVQTALKSVSEPSFGLIRPPGHHASATSCWGFCYFNNMAVSLLRLKRDNLIERAFVLDFDLHFGDGNVNILDRNPWVEILNPEASDRDAFLEEVRIALEGTTADMIAVSAGFDNHVNDWGGLLLSSDYEIMGQWVRQAADKNGGGCYGLLEGGYNHNVLGKNVLAFIEGLADR